MNFKTLSIQMMDDEKVITYCKSNPNVSGCKEIEYPSKVSQSPGLILNTVSFSFTENKQYLEMSIGFRPQAIVDCKGLSSKYLKLLLKTVTEH